MSEPSSADEFDQFLEESMKKVGDRDALEVTRIRIEDIVNNVLTELGYTAIDEDEERALTAREQQRAALEDYFRRTRGEDWYDPDLMDQMLDHFILEKPAQERLILLFLKIALLAATTSDRGADEQEDIKRRFFAEAFVIHELRTYDTLYHVSNLVLPGPVVDLGDPVMEPYLDQAELDTARDKERTERSREFVTRALASVGIPYDAKNPENAPFIVAAHHMSVIATIHRNDAAEREQALRENALAQTGDHTIIAGLTEFFIRHLEPRSP